MRTNGPARRDGGRREKIRRERVRLYFCISIWMPRETKGCFFFQVEVCIGFLGSCHVIWC
jgi:hypothetical protein